MPSLGRRSVALSTVGLVVMITIIGAACSSGGVPPTAEGASTTSSSAPSTTVTFGSSRIAEAAVAFVQLLAKGAFAEAVGQFDETMKQALPEEKLREAWTQVQGQAGAFQEVTGARVEQQSGYDVGLVTTRFGTTLLDVKVVYDKSGSVAGLFFVPSTAPT